MDIQKINTVQDLMEANDKLNPEHQIMEILKGMGPAEHLKIALWITETLSDWHSNISLEMVDDHTGDSGNPYPWALDAGKLEVAVAILKGIEL